VFSGELRYETLQDWYAGLKHDAPRRLANRMEYLARRKHLERHEQWPNHLLAEYKRIRRLQKTKPRSFFRQCPLGRIDFRSVCPNSDKKFAYFL